MYSQHGTIVKQVSLTLNLSTLLYHFPCTDTPSYAKLVLSAKTFTIIKEGQIRVIPRQMSRFSNLL